MKPIFFWKGLVLMLVSLNCTVAQTVNWAHLETPRQHLLQVNAGLEYAVVFGATYGYRLKSTLPVLVEANYSFPVGNAIFDDHKARLGAGIRLLRVGDFRLSAKVSGIYRKFENNYVKLLNFGGEGIAVLGWYRPKGFLGIECGFDKAIATHFRHSGRMREQFPGVKNGWADPPTGGNFFYGIQGGISFRKNSVFLKAGKVVGEDLKNKPLMPYTAEVGYNIRWN